MSKKQLVPKTRKRPERLRHFNLLPAEVVPMVPAGGFAELTIARQIYRSGYSTYKKEHTQRKFVEYLNYELRWLMEHRYPDYYKPCIVFKAGLRCGVEEFIVLAPNRHDVDKVYVGFEQHFGGVGAAPLVARSCFPLRHTDTDEEYTLDLIAALNIGRRSRKAQGLDAIIQTQINSHENVHH